MLPADNSACVAIVVVTVVHLDASHSTPTGHTRISVVPHAAYLMLLSIPAPARGDKLRLAVLRLHFIFMSILSLLLHIRLRLQFDERSLNGTGPTEWDCLPALCSSTYSIYLSTTESVGYAHSNARSSATR